jgi:SAM-dependent methyltransferase
MLDVQRQNAKFHVKDAVRIPLSELEGRLHELPPKDDIILVADVGPMAIEAVRRLAALGRPAELAHPLPADSPQPGRLWDPNPFVSETLERIPSGRAADLACGGGRDALAMAAAGWDVVALDQLAENLARAKGMADRYLSPEEANRIVWRCETLAGSFDASGFDLVCLCFYMDRALVRSLVASLPVGSRLLIETFTTIHRENVGKPASDERVLFPGELRAMLDSLEIERYEEGWHRHRHTARCVALRR